MTRKFDLEVIDYKKVSSIKEAWNTQDYTAILELMDNDDVAGMSDSDIKEMCMMSLNDLEPEEAANVVLTHLFGDVITSGKIDQIASQMSDDRLWEEFADPQFHEKLFNAYGLLREAFNGIFTKPTGVITRLLIHAENEQAQQQLENAPKATLVRIISQGLEDYSLMNRLFDEQISGQDFEEAEGILWRATVIKQAELQTEYEIISSELWLGDLENVSSIKAKITAESTED
jgi:hypothetical protein